jgi:XTP/dITP diphosphohydrolase
MNEVNIIFVSNNKKKINELSALLSDFPLPVRPYTDIITTPLSINETGSSFKENALIKVSAVAPLLDTRNIAVIADDSGLEIPALQNAPGVYSARFGGTKLTDQERCQLIIDKLNGHADRSARLVSYIAIQLPNHTQHFTKGILNGVISPKINGNNGFGYDPIFIPDGFNLSLGQLGPNIKNKISHRYQSILAASKIILAFSSQLTSKSK